MIKSIINQNTDVVTTDTIKRLTSSSKYRSVEVINNPTKLGSNHRDVNYMNYK
jgi:hypothetical protein